MTLKFRDLGMRWRTFLFLRYSFLVVCLFQEGNQGPIWLSNLPQDNSISTRRGRSQAGAMITPVYQLADLKSCAQSDLLP